MNHEGGLRLPAAVGPGDLDAQLMTQSWNTFDDVELELTLMGFPPLEQPKHARPQLTLEILATPNSREYTDLYLKVEAWHNFAFNTMARIKAILIGYENEQNEIARGIRKEFAAPDPSGGKKAKVNKSSIEDTIAEHPRFRELTFEMQKWEQKKIILQSHVDSLDRDLKMVSRQVEIRRQDIDNGRRGSNMPSHGGRRPGLGMPYGQGYQQGGGDPGDTE